MRRDAGNYRNIYTHIEKIFMWDKVPCILMTKEAVPHAMKDSMIDSLHTSHAGFWG